jgi:hypothetical protein
MLKRDPFSLIDICPKNRFAEELGSFQLRMDKLLSKVCSQQEPLSGWYVVRNELDRKSRYDNAPCAS